MTDEYISEVGDPIPDDLGDCVDLLKDLTEDRLDAEKEAKAIKAREAEIRDHLIDNLSADDKKGVMGSEYKAVVKTKRKPTVDDWDAVYDHIAEHDAFYLLNKSISARAIQEIWDADNNVPGVSGINVKTLSITKI